jgi:hypothetical protein
MSRHDNNQLARDGEHWALDELKRQGHDAQLYGGTYSFDILIANRARIEVKTSFLGKTDNYSQRWQFSFNRYGRFCADLLLCICAPDNFPDSEPLTVFIIPRQALAEGQQKITIPNTDPQCYGGKYAQGRDAWDAVEQIVALCEEFVEEDEPIPF